MSGKSRTFGIVGGILLKQTAIGQQLNVLQDSTEKHNKITGLKATAASGDLYTISKENIASQHSQQTYSSVRTIQNVGLFAQSTCRRPSQENVQSSCPSSPVKLF